MSRELTKTEQIERSILTKFRKTLWNPFTAGVKRYSLISAGDKIAVCISGGKDSMLLAKLMQELQKHSDVPFELTFLCMNPGYNPENVAKIKENAEILGIPLCMFETDIFDIANGVDEGSPCYLCARMRRGNLYSKAKEMGCNKIALGHHFSDVIETTLLGLFYGSQLQAMMPMLHSTNFEGMDLIRPMYCVHEEDIIHWANYNGLSFLQCACRFTAEKQSSSKRFEMKALIAELRKTNPNVEQSIFNAIHNLCLDTFPSYKSKGEIHNFLDDF